MFDDEFDGVLDVDEIPNSEKRFVRVGWESSVVAVDEIKAVLHLNCNGAQMRYVKEAAAMNMLLDATDMRTARTLILMKDGLVIKASRKFEDITKDLLKVD